MTRQVPRAAGARRTRAAATPRAKPERRAPAADLRMWAPLATGASPATAASTATAVRVAGARPPWPRRAATPSAATTATRPRISAQTIATARRTTAVTTKRSAPGGAKWRGPARSRRSVDCQSRGVPLSRSRGRSQRSGLDVDDPASCASDLLPLWPSSQSRALRLRLYMSPPGRDLARACPHPLLRLRRVARTNPPLPGRRSWPTTRPGMAMTCLARSHLANAQSPSAPHRRITGLTAPSSRRLSSDGVLC
jgi:hypothetical protein